MRYAVNASHAGGGLLNVMTTTLTTIMKSTTLVLLLIIMLITATLHNHNVTKIPYRASAAQIPVIVTVSNLLNVLTVPLYLFPMLQCDGTYYVYIVYCISHPTPTEVLLLVSQNSSSLLPCLLRLIQGV